MIAVNRHDRNALKGLGTNGHGEFDKEPEKECVIGMRASQQGLHRPRERNVLGMVNGNG